MAKSKKCIFIQPASLQLPHVLEMLKKQNFVLTTNIIVGIMT